MPAFFFKRKQTMIFEQGKKKEKKRKREERRGRFIRKARRFFLWKKISVTRFKYLKY